MTKKRILIVDDHPLIRCGLATIIASAPGLEVRGEAGSAPEAIEKIEAPVPDLVTVDISLDGMRGLELVKRLKEKHPGLPALGPAGARHIHAR